MNPFKTAAIYIAMKHRFYRFSREKLSEYQLKRVRKICSYAAHHSPFFREYFAGVRPGTLTFDELDSLAPIDKSTMMDDFTRYNTAGLNGDELLSFAAKNDQERNYNRYFRGRYSVGISSGTSGASALAVYSKREIAGSIPKFLARNGMPKGIRQHRIMFALRISVPAFHEINRFGYRLIHYRYDVPPKEIIAGINRKKLNILAGSPTFLAQLAPYAGLIDHPVDVVISYAEILEEHVEQLLRNAFNAPVRQLYAATEGYIAASCPEGRLHLNEDLLRFKLDPVEGRPGVYTMKITDLYRRTQPIINYTMGDMIELDDSVCSCGSGFRLIKRIIGRSDDYLLVAAGSTVDGAVRAGDSTGGARGSSGATAGDLSSPPTRIVYADYVRRAIITAADGIREYRVVQKSLLDVTVLVSFVDELERDPAQGDGSGGAVDERSARVSRSNAERRMQIQKTLLDLFDRYTHELPRVTVTEGAVELDPETKMKRVMREF